MDKNKSQKDKKKKEIKFGSLNIDKAEYQQIVTSQTNFPDKGFFGKR